MLTAVHLWKNDSFLDQSAFLCVFFFPERDSHPSQAGVFGKFPSGSGRCCPCVCKWERVCVHWCSPSCLKEIYLYLVSKTLLIDELNWRSDLLP